MIKLQSYLSMKLTFLIKFCIYKKNEQILGPYKCVRTVMSRGWLHNLFN